MGRGTCLVGLVFFRSLSKRATFFPSLYDPPKYSDRRNLIGERGLASIP